jgi:hypothetical protein
MKQTIRTFSAVLLLCTAQSLFAQTSGREYQRSAIMDGNQVKTVFGNWGVIGQPANVGYRGSWRNPNDGYIGDVTPMIGAEINWGYSTFHSVATCPVARPTGLPDDINGTPSTMQPVGGYFNANQTKVALSNDINSWPPTWPDKLQDPTDPGWPRSWNGYFGKKSSADLETYFVMDDNNDIRFNYASNNLFGVAFKPDSTNLSRNGMGLVVRVRALQWAQFLAKDNIFWLYEVTNTGTTTYSKAVMGMLVGTYVGVTSTEDYQEYNNDFSFYDPFLNLTYTGDYDAINGRKMKNPLWVGGTGLVGYAFLESPGNPYDGIDNDGDADSSAFGSSSPKFTATDFDSVTILPGQQIVLINQDYSRQLYTVPNVDSVQITTRGKTTWIYPGRTRVAEGNRIADAAGNDVINQNAYDGVDNNFNGLIDENYYLHYRQVKITKTIPADTLFNILRPLRHVDYLGGKVGDWMSMVDERRDDLKDNNLDWEQSTDDVGRDGVADTKDFGEGDGVPTSGYDMNHNDTGLPGEPHIDKTDIRESDQIGLTSFNYFTPANAFKLGDKEALWAQLAPGFFDVPLTIKKGVPQAGQDGDFIYGTGYFPLVAKETERFSLALVYGGGQGGGLNADLTDLRKNKTTVQKIYDANYQFPQPPDKPTLTAVIGDHQVTLYWDRKAETTIDPVLRVKTFEGYKIYRSTDPNFSDIFTITDGSGAPQGYKPLKQFDLVDGVTGYFQATGEAYQGAAGFTYYLGNDNGIQHSYIDRDVENGRRYYYAVVAYSKGDAFTSIFPAENTKQVSVLSTGEVIHDINVAVVVPNAPVSGFVPPDGSVAVNHVQRYGTGSVYYNVIDQTALKPHSYQVEFFDTQVDSLDANGNDLVSMDSTTWNRVTTAYRVRDFTNTVERFVSADTTAVTLSHKNLVESTVSVTTASGDIVPASSYILNAPLGTIRGRSGGNFPAGTLTITYQYFPVNRSPYIQGNPKLTDTKDADIFAGIQLSFDNSWDTFKIDSSSGWVGNPAYNYSFAPTNLFLGDLKGYRHPSDYEFQFSNTVVDTSVANPNLLLEAVATPCKFRIFNTTDSTYIKYYYYDYSGYGGGGLAGDVEVVMLEKNPRGVYSPTWDSYFSVRVGDRADTIYVLGSNDRLVIKTRKPFRRGDVFTFTPTLPRVDADSAKKVVSRVRVVPNPYVAAAQFELPLNPGITSGRGQRRIDFIHVPAGATIKIFTARGEYVNTLRHDGNIEDGTVSWNLRTFENLDVAFGIYFYVVESPAGNTTGKIAIIK